MKAVFCRETLWDDPHLLSTNYLARALSRQNWEILWLTRPWHPYGLFVPRWMPQKWKKVRTWLQGGETLEGGRVRSYAFGTLLPYRRAPLLGGLWAARHTLHAAFPPVSFKLRSLGFGRADLLVLSDLCQAPILKWITAGQTVFQATDDYSAFRTTPRSALALESWVLQNVDTVITPGRRLAQALSARHGIPLSKFLVVPHGVEEDISLTGPSPDDFERIPRPRAVYLGALEEWIDWDLVEAVATSAPGISIVFIGGVNSDDPAMAPRIRSLRRHPNLHFLGPKAHRTAMACLAGADAGIIPFQTPSASGMSAAPRASLKNIGACPMKLLEYFAFGLPVVSTLNYWDELPGGVATPAYRAPDREAFVSALRTATAEGQRRRDELRALGRKFSTENTWDKRIRSILHRSNLQRTEGCP